MKRAGIAAASLLAAVGAAAGQEPPPAERGDGVRVEARDASERPLAREIASTFPALSREVEMRLGFAVGGEVTILLDRLGDGGPHPDGPGGTVALASADSRTIRLDPSRLGLAAPLRSVLAHETAHLLLGRAAPGRLPLWFEEGVAEWVASAYGRADRAALARAAAAGRLPQLAEIAVSFPEDGDARVVAYAFAREAVATVAEGAGAGALRETVRLAAGGTPFAEALRLATGQGPEGWEAAVRARLSGPGLLRRLFEGNPELVWLALLAVGGGLVVVAVRRRRRAAAAKLAATEPPEDEPSPSDADAESAEGPQPWEEEDDEEDAFPPEVTR
ncbi:MAG: hypothetical protein L0216_02780 [Planctomycetales bacterium]|nr:hypothetical protein [Planctomycetales bacterium]